jgi:NADPH:quinone reductase-like Zn-dependent oxidoreductase/uncharacterized protein YndB with AHSA1/START domain
MLQKIVRSTVIDAPIERVWAVLRDFDSHDQWHDVVDTSRIESERRSDEVGCVRSFTLADGNHVREQLLALDDREHKSTYCIVEATVPLERYVATVTLKPVTDGNRTFWHWESSFATPPGREAELREMVAKGVYEAGFANLRRHLERGGDVAADAMREGRRAEPLPRALPLPTRRVVLRAYGDPDVLEPDDGEAPPPGPGEVRIRQRAVGVNFFDVYLRRGWIPAMLPLPGTLGMEAAGSVIDVGDGVTGFMPGDRVAYLCPQPGAYASVRTVAARHVVRLPAAVDDDVAAALLLKGCTADLLLRDLGRVDHARVSAHDPSARVGAHDPNARVSAHDPNARVSAHERSTRVFAHEPATRVLVHAAAGALGLLVCSLAKSLGAIVIGTVSSDAKARIAREHGCEHVIVTGAGDGRGVVFADAVQRLGGAQLIVDGLGAPAFDENLRALASGGHWISVGQAGGALPPLSPDALVAKSATFSRPVIFDHVATPEQLERRASRVWADLASGAMARPMIERHALEAAAQAHRRLESRDRVGAIVLVP